MAGGRSRGWEGDYIQEVRESYREGDESPRVPGQVLNLSQVPTSEQGVAVTRGCPALS